jgi:hypothetical protein
MKVINLHSQSGDWEALYVNGEMIAEGHRINRHEWLVYAEIYKYTSMDIKSKTLSNNDDEDTQSFGSFYRTLLEFDEDYSL